MPKSAAQFPKTRLLRIAAAALLAAGLALALVPVAGAQAASASVSESRGTVQRATEEASLLRKALANAETDLVAADEERKAAEFTALFTRSSRSFFLGTFATKQGVQEEYDQAMEAAADAHARVADKVDAVETELAAAERNLSLEEDGLAAHARAAEEAGSNVVSFASIGGALGLAAVGLFVWTFRKRSAPKAQS